MAIIRDQKTGRIWRRMTVKTVVNGGDRTNGARIERTIRMGRLSSAALFNRAATGIVFCQPRWPWRPTPMVLLSRLRSPDVQALASALLEHVRLSPMPRSHLPVCARAW